MLVGQLRFRPSTSTSMHRDYLGTARAGDVGTLFESVLTENECEYYSQ